jgi:hypothetical protein
MSISRASLVRGPAKVTFGGTTLFTRDDIVTRHAPVFEPVSSSLHGDVDQFKKDLVIKHSLTLFGLWQDLPVLFPAAIMNPTVGASLFGVVDNAMIVHAKNQDRVTYHNSQITKLIDLFLGVDSEMFAAAVEITSLIKNNANPEDAAAYFTRDTAAYAETTFALTNFKKTRFTAAWGAKTGFTSFIGEKGFNIAWEFTPEAQVVDGLGTVDIYIAKGSLKGRCRCVPIGPTLAQIDAQQPLASAHGALLSANAADLTLTGTGVSVVLKGAGMIESGTAYGTTPLRNGEVAWETTRGFTTGTPNAVATVA